MKLLGIDYGTKRIGVATCDTDVGMAFPKAVLKNDNNVVSVLKDLCQKEEIEKIILGESKNLNGEDNKIFEEIKRFKASVENATAIETIFQPEFYTTYQASRIQGDSEMIDASAATIILQSYVDRFKN